MVLWTLPLGLLASGSAGVRTDPETSPPAAQPDAIQLALGETGARLTVPVAIVRQGPYNFIIDTGAERTVVSRELAGRLGLAAGGEVTVTSMTGRSRVATVVVPDLAIESIGTSHTIVAPAFEARNIGAAGLLGIDTLRDHQVTIDFDAGTMAVHPSVKRKRNEKHAPDEIVVTAKDQFGQLIVTDAYYGNARVQVVLDTGSQVTMGNEALRRKVGKNVDALQTIELTSVDGGKTLAQYGQVPAMRVSNVAFDTLPVAFAEAEPFKRFGLTKRPAIMLGMDAMRSFRRVEIDFPNRQVRFFLPRGMRERRPDFTSPLFGTGFRSGARD
ncbi:retroviral-like aspartic protease family protein [Sphingomonas azotifigens]|uniref:retroviral-like aspartic protease family protein n=1 Tax=Sphingomonas azotifigens TaxID=330920 RepID=UPI001FEA8485|nr:retroviral-like aspartic protease family protein [Sphingomonas azotifigens]